MIKPAFCICENKAFVFATQIVHSPYFLNPKFQASCHLLLLYNLVCVEPGRKYRGRFSHDGALGRIRTNTDADADEVGDKIRTRSNMPLPPAVEGGGHKTCS